MSKFHISGKEFLKRDYEDALKDAAMFLDEQINDEMFRAACAGVKIEDVPRFRDYIDRRKRYE